MICCVAFFTFTSCVCTQLGYLTHSLIQKAGGVWLEVFDFSSLLNFSNETKFQRNNNKKTKRNHTNIRKEIKSYPI